MYVAVKSEDRASGDKGYGMIRNVCARADNPVGEVGNERQSSQNTTSEVRKTVGSPLNDLCIINMLIDNIFH